MVSLEIPMAFIPKAFISDPHAAAVCVADRACLVRQLNKRFNVRLCIFCISIKDLFMRK